MITNTDVPTDHTGTRGESSNSVGGGEAPAAPQPFSPSSSGSAHGGGTGDVGGVNGGGGEDRHDWREVRFSTPGQGGNGRERGKGTEEATVSSASAAAKGVQVRNLSTGDVDVFNGAGRARERASTDGGPAEDPRVRFGAKETWEVWVKEYFGSWDDGCFFLVERKLSKISPKY